MDFYDVITKRKSVRKYSGRPSDGQMSALKDFIGGIKPLYGNIGVKMILAGADKVKGKGNGAEDYLLFYSEDKPNARVNCGYILQKAEMFLQVNGIGVCWYGMGKTELPAECGYKFIIMLAFGVPEGEQFRELKDFKRKALKDTADFESEIFDIARLAPSAINIQPWRVFQDENRYHIYRAEPGFPHAILGKLIVGMNQVDMGIYLSVLEEVYAHFGKTAVFTAETAPARKGLEYIISVNK